MCSKPSQACGILHEAASDLDHDLELDPQHLFNACLHPCQPDILALLTTMFRGSRSMRSIITG